MAKVINTKDKADDASKCSSESKVYKPLQASFFSKTIQTIKKQFQAIQVLFFL